METLPMAFLTTLPGLTLITKFYSAYALSLAFILQSSLTLLLALAACTVHVLLRRRILRRQTLSPSKVVYKIQQ